VTAKLDMHRFTLKTVPALLAKRKRDPWADLLGEAADLPACLARLGELL
jgi:DNA primase